MIYFTSDWHLYHDNIIDLVCRPFRTEHKMRKALIRNYNEVVTEKDTCYFIGDFFWGKSQHNLEIVLNKLNGRKILILGNHDLFKPFDYIEAGFESVHTSLEYGGMILNHDPAVSCIDRNKIFICGHVHDLFVKHKNVVNVGVDVNNFRPVRLDAIKGVFFQG